MPGEILPVLLAAAIAPITVASGISAVKMSMHPNTANGDGAAQIAKANREGRRLAAQGTTSEMAERRWGQTAPRRK